MLICNLVDKVSLSRISLAIVFISAAAFVPVARAQTSTGSAAAPQADIDLKSPDGRLAITFRAVADNSGGPPNQGSRAPSQLVSIDIPSALSRALTSRPEFEAVRQQLTVDDLKIRLAHNRLRPDLELVGVYSTIGVGGNQLSLTRPPVPVAYGGLTDSLSQIFHFNNPTYGLALTLTLPIKNRGAQADLGDALVSRQHDQYQQVKTTQIITLDVANAVHQLEQAKLALEAATVSVDLAQKNLQAEERKHELGSETAFFVLDAQTQLAQAEFSLAQAQTNYQLALASLDHATGELLVHHYVQLQPAPR